MAKTPTTRKKKTSRAKTTKKSVGKRTKFTPGDVAHILKDLRPLAIPIDSITLDPANPVTHPDEQIERLGANIAKVGQHRPIVCRRSDTGALVCMVGNAALEAMRRRGFVAVAAIVTHENETEARTRALLDNDASRGAIMDEQAEAALLQAVLTDEGDDDELLAAFGGDDRIATFLQQLEDEKPKRSTRTDPAKAVRFKLGGHGWNVDREVYDRWLAAVPGETDEDKIAELKRRLGIPE